MGFYDEAENVDLYEEMCVGYDGSAIHALLAKHLEPGQSLLELGCGPGNDIEFFRQKYGVFGSDSSEEFLRRGRDRFPTIDFIELDAVTIETDKRFDCIFSNKVLHHLKFEDLVFSLKRQAQVISPGGLFAHSFWIGDGEEEKHGMYFRYYGREELSHMIGEYFDIVELFDYAELEEGDSLFIVARNGSASTETIVMR